MENVKPALIVHGGAWAIPDTLAAASIEGVKSAARQGYELLMKGESALDAVEAAVVCLENDPAFDAGTGSVLNDAGQVEMDAVIMEGTRLNAGAVACVKNIRNPVKLARQVMEKTQHILLVGEGANAFAKEVGMATVDTAELVTSEARAEWENYKQYPRTVATFFNNKLNVTGCDTVGAVAIDSQGRIACATSTGGITGKRVGRVGDAPIIGSGAYCDNAIGGVSSTGHGESIAKVCLARRVTEYLEQGCSTQVAVEKALAFMSQRVAGGGGAIAIDKNGDLGFSFTTERMAWAWAKDNTLCYGLDPEQCNTQDLLP